LLTHNAAAAFLSCCQNEATATAMGKLIFADQMLWNTEVLPRKTPARLPPIDRGSIMEAAPEQCSISHL
jgi:hypothetical protein